MKKLFLVLGLTTLWATIPAAKGQTIDKDTAKQQGGQLGTALNPSVTQGIKTGNPSTVVPGYSSNPTQKQYFQNGQGSTVGPGATRVAGCTNQSDVECQAVNLMQNGPQTRPQFNITRSDPLLARSKGLTSNPTGQIGDIFSSYDTCKTTTTTIPPTFETQVCDEFSVNEDKVCSMGQQVVVDPDYLYKCVETIQSQANRTCTMGRVVQVSPQYDYQCQQTLKGYETLSCKRTLNTTCLFSGAQMSSTLTNQSGLFPTVTITPSGTPGLYNYVMDRPYRVCNTDGWAEISFNMDTVGQGSYMTLNVSNLDDAAAIGVNGYTVFAGYPNNGPYYEGSFFGQNTAAFQLGYSWNEDVGGNQCVETDYEGYCIRRAWVSKITNFYANTKLLDYCPSGYVPTSQKSYQYCDPESGFCTPPDSYTPKNIMGFFCNAEGKFLMNRHEGKNNWAGSVSSQMPLKVGTNKIQLYWGTGTWNDACGNVNVSGQIYNVAPKCAGPTWDNQCAALEMRSQ